MLKTPHSQLFKGILVMLSFPGQNKKMEAGSHENDGIQRQINAETRPSRM